MNSLYFYKFPLKTEELLSSVFFCIYYLTFIQKRYKIDVYVYNL